MNGFHIAMEIFLTVKPLQLEKFGQRYRIAEIRSLITQQLEQKNLTAKKQIPYESITNL